MRLRRLGLDYYGNFASTTLTLDPAPGRINLIVAPNGAGKSVLRQAIAELLFGIHPQTPMGFLFDYARMRLQAEAVFADGEALGFIRRKGRSNTLTDLAGQPAPASLAARLPQESERKRLERLFVLDSTQLRAGGKALLQSDGDLADALLSSAGDLGSARKLAAELADRRDAIAPTRKKASALFYEACDAWTAAGTRLAETIVRPPVVAEQEQARDEAAAAQQAAKAQAAAANATQTRLARVRSTRRHLEELDAAAAWLDQHPDIPVLPPPIGLALAHAKEAAEAAAHQASTTQQHHAELAAQLGETTPDEAVLAEAAAIERLVAEQALADQSQQDIPKRQAELAEAQAAIARLLRELSSAADPADAAAEMRSAADIAAARSLIAQSAEVTATLAAARAAMAQQRDALAAIEDDLAALPPATETDALRAAVVEATADGEVARQANQAQTALNEAEARLVAALARVPGWQGDAPALTALPIPGEASLARLDRTLTEAQTAVTTAENRRRAAETELTAARDRLAALTGGQPLPDEAAVATARTHRDRGWALIYARLTNAADPAGEAAYAPGTPLALAFQQAVAAADALADRRHAEVERLAKAGEMTAAILRAEAALAASTAQCATAGSIAEAARTAWAAAVVPMGLPPASGLAEIRSFLAARDVVVDAVARHQTAQQAQSALAAQQADWAARLAGLMQTAPDSLTRLIAAARHKLSEAERIAAQRQALTRQQITLKRDAAKAGPALEQAEAAMADWGHRWSAVLARLQRPGGELPAATAAILDRLVALPAKVEAAQTTTGRLAEMHAQLARFTTACASIATRLGEAPSEPAAMMRRLTARLTATRSAIAARDELQRQTAAAAERHRLAALAQAEAQHALHRAIQATGADTLEAAERLVALAADRATQEAARTAALLRLREDGDGLDVAALRTEADAIPPETIASAIRAAEEQAAEAQQAAQDAAARIERAEGALRRLEAGQDAARAATERQAAAATLSRVLEDALVQHLAATMLEAGLKTVEASTATNQRRTRIGQTFAQLTNGAYDRLSPADEDGDSKEHGRLIAHEAGGAEKHIARLSEGTRDQLYLALRLVAVEDYARGAAPLPFVVDDVLQTFDDERARAALQALVGLSEHAQVIVLTHHPHLLTVAEGLPVHVQTL
jgi:uncharacterized protein YhaN